MSVFDWIAPVYGLAFGHQRRHYRREIARLLAAGALEGRPEILDVGCGTGALCAAFADEGFAASGVDVSRRMLAVARRRTKGLGVPLSHADATGPLPFPDASFDVVVAAFVSHGMAREPRARLLAEMRRVARRAVLLYDYGMRRSRLVDLVEAAEGGHYFDYLREIRPQFEEAFPGFRTIDGGGHAQWYWGEVPGSARKG